MKLPFLKRKSSEGVKLVVIRDSNSDVHQWSLSQNTIVAVSILAVVLSTAVLIFSADILTRFMYKSRLEEVKQNNRSLISLLLDLRSDLDEMKVDMNQLEEKDRALRTYANLPAIDRDVREVGVGRLTTRRSDLDELLPDIEEKVTQLEIDINELSRKVRLEKESFETVFDALKNSTEKLPSIPSIRPAGGGYLNSGFGYRNDPFSSEKRFHHGLDISAPNGTPVYSAADGKVVYASYKGTYGQSIKINHGHGYQSFYAHLMKMLVKPGEVVKRGDLIGEIGNTGRSTAPHLHYEVHYYGTPQNPKNYFFAGRLE
ncbi:MAG: M23 family metallopeptidase [Candidatus Marinimicrobia bacterium]|jgi:murein DD-endopeptidase MepM/ murein hydrolase activator NlpD|nr:peptidase M23 [Candidatus Neomarinimicrobiota bacterium]MDP6593737.1 M23 family metallopeptidase [Candidatus Neomarinimicrobiota bacterium]|tara:strand:- start:1169 stop:2113 length:945 start_codon:yes stop_codon:yes gene_type:complete